jgi:hypothetical protein
VALHRPITFDWPARFGLSASPRPTSEDPVPAARSSASTMVPRPSRPWLVKYDGPCSRCGTILVKGTPAVWSSSTREMLCLDCAGPR